MLSIDTNVLLYALNRDCAEHEAASAFLAECAGRRDIALCELVLVELYQLLRNPAVVEQPPTAPVAAQTCERFRSNPRWALLGDAPVTDKVWRFAARPGLAQRRLFDARIAYTLLHYGVNELATRNVKDFREFEFDHVWDPIVPG